MKCFECPKTFETKEEYEDHLLLKHAETWLARRVQRERNKRNLKIATPK